MEAAFAVAVIQALSTLAALWLSERRQLLQKRLPFLVSIAVGVLLATALLHILPEAVLALGSRRALWATLIGTMFTMFCIERIVAAWSDRPTAELEKVNRKRGLHQHTEPLSLAVGGMLHSFVDGVGVAAAFSAGRRVGWLTTIAITLHEVPHRMGDYALFTHLGMARNKALQLLGMIALSASAGVLVVVLAGHALPATNWLLPVSAGSFVYIATVNLMPELAGERRMPQVCWQLACMVLGALLVALLLSLPGFE